MIKKLLFILFLTGAFCLNAQLWMQRSDLGGLARHRGTGMSIANKGYIGLGHFNGTGVNIVLKDWWQYDPATNSWSQKADYEGNAGNGNYAVIALGMESHGYIAGGVFSNTETWKYIPLTNSWIQVQDMPTGVSDIVGFAIGNYGYYVTNNQLWALNGTTDMWEPRNAVSFSNSIWNSSFVIDGKGYLKNGSALWEYKPSIDSWISRAPFPGLASGGSVGLSQYGKGYIVAGYQGSLSGVVKENWEFNPATNTWRQLDDFPGTARRFSSGFNIGERSFFGTGTNGTNFKDLWEFSSILSIPNLSEDVKIQTFPNPSKDKIEITWANNNFNFAVYSITGQLISKGSAYTTLNLYKYEIGRGTFIVNLTNNNGANQQLKIDFL